MDRRGMFATTATSFLIARPPNYDKYASSYDSTSSPSSPLPTLLGISKLRASLISTYAYGDVIEVGGGTGGNLVGGYDFGGVDSVTLTDVSSEMMKIAKTKVEGVLENASRKISFAELNILDPVGEKFLGRFDTVVCTFVLCVLGNDEDVRAGLRNLLKLRKKGGRVIIFENTKPPQSSLLTSYLAFTSPITSRFGGKDARSDIDIGKLIEEDFNGEIIYHESCGGDAYAAFVLE